MFQGRHTDWLLLNEPDLAEVTPLSVATRFKKLHELYEAKQAAVVLPDDKAKGIDFNQLTRAILQDAEVLKDKVHSRWLGKYAQRAAA